MHASFLRNCAFLLLTAVLTAPVLLSGCAAHVRVYDPYYHQYHAWAAEEPYYRRWESETHRRHTDYAKRSEAEQREYWDWRHNQH